MEFDKFIELFTPSELDAAIKGRMDSYQEETELIRLAVSAGYINAKTGKNRPLFTKDKTKREKVGRIDPAEKRAQLEQLMESF